MHNYVRKPFIGPLAYEFQVLGLVLMLSWPHTSWNKDGEHKVGWRAYVVWDKYWKRW